MTSVKEIAEAYELKEDAVQALVDAALAEEKKITPKAPKNELLERAMRTVLLDLKSKKFNIAAGVTCEGIVIGAKKPFNFKLKRMKDLQNLFKIRPDEAQTKGIKDAKCDADGNVVNKKDGKPYERDGFVTTVHIYDMGAKKALHTTSFNLKPEDFEKITPFTKVYSVIISGNDVTFEKEVRDATKDEQVKARESIPEVAVEELDAYYAKVTPGGIPFKDSDVCCIKCDVSQVYTDTKYYIDDASSTKAIPRITYNNSAFKAEVFKNAKLELVASLNKTADGNIVVDACGIYTVPSADGGIVKPQIKAVEPEELPKNAEAIADKVVSLLVSNDSGMTLDDIANQSGFAKSEINAVLEDLLKDKSIEKKSQKYFVAA